MITGKEGGFVHRIIPPVDWDCGPIPEECNNPELIASDIEDLLFPDYDKRALDGKDRNEGL